MEQRAHQCWVGRLALAATLVLSFSAPAPAWAATKKGKKAAKSPDEIEAAKLYKKAKTAYDVGKFEAALVDLEKAYELFPSPAIQFNLAQVHRQLGNLESARYLYARYAETLRERLIEAKPKDIERLEGKIAKIEATIEEIDAALRAAAAAPETMPETAPAETSPALRPEAKKSKLEAKYLAYGGAGLAAAAVIATTIVLLIVQPGWVRIPDTALGSQIVYSE